ncbi:MAG: type II toxin-antitoxin system ParD family antitoxin [Armatimonadetes bacterium]|nr:type II toxin-antitoxin system ParD family antitoxin [Armatimonadota bacterium]
MNISLTPRLEELIKKKVESGMYGSSSEVVREALRLLEEHDTITEMRNADLRREIQKGLDQLDRGEKIEFTEAVRDDIKRRGIERLQQRQATNRAAK